MFFCKTRGFYPSCHAKRREEWGEWVWEEFFLDVPQRQVVFTVPKMLRLFFRFKRKPLNSLCLSAVQTLVKFLYTVTGLELMPGVVAVIQTFGDRKDRNFLFAVEKKSFSVFQPFILDDTKKTVPVMIPDGNPLVFDLHFLSLDQLGMV